MKQKSQEITGVSRLRRNWKLFVLLLMGKEFEMVPAVVENGMAVFQKIKHLITI